MDTTTTGHFIVEVIADSTGKWCGNALTFDTADKAEAYARDLYSRWVLVEDWRVMRVTAKRRRTVRRKP